MWLHEKGEDDKSFRVSDLQNSVLATVIYLGASNTRQLHIPENFDPLFAGYHAIVEKDFFEYLVIPAFLGFLTGLAIASVSKPDRPFWVHALPGLCVFIAALVTSINVASPVTLQIGNFFSSGAAAGSYALGRSLRYRSSENGW